MNLKGLSRVVKKKVDERGGPQALLRDAKQVQAAMKGGGTTSDKAKRAAEALKQDGTRGPRRRTGG